MINLWPIPASGFLVVILSFAAWLIWQDLDGDDRRMSLRVLATAIAIAILGAMLCLLTGCAHFTSRQVETTCDGTQRTTTVKVGTFFTAHNDLAKLRASTTEKTQGVSLAGLDQNSSSTNAVEMLRLIGAILGAAAK